MPVLFPRVPRPALTSLLVAAAVAVVVLLAGPELMQLAFGDSYIYDRAGLLIVTAAMGFHLVSLTLNQAALAQGQARRAAIRWGICAVGFIGWCFVPVFEVVRRVEIGFAGAAVLLCGLLYLLYVAPRSWPGDRVVPDPTQPGATRLRPEDAVR